MSTVKYQIFISSTYTDLKDERDVVIKAVLEMGHIPVGMEMFSAADEEQWKLISRQIDQSDYYVVIIAHRYGSVVRKKSYTEKEYDYAVQKGVPVAGFIIDDSASWPKDKMETDVEKTKCLELFKQKVKLKLVGFWSSKDELHGKVAVSLMKLIVTDPRPGWVRTSETVGSEVVNEMSRLSSENARLSHENIQLKEQLEENKKIDNSHFSQGEDLIEIRFNINKNEDNSFSISWDNLFLEIGKGLLENTAEASVQEKIVGIIQKIVVQPQMENRQKQIEEYIQKHPSESDSDDPIRSMYPSDWMPLPMLNEGELLKIKTQFITLGFIDIQMLNMRNEHPIFKTAQIAEPYWILTELGKRKITELSAIRRYVEHKPDPDET